MFFIFGISNGEKKLDFVQTMLCSRCGQFGRLEVYVTYMYFSLFFIPIFHWGKCYYVKSSCCNAVYGIEKELGKQIQRGEKVALKESDLHVMNQQSGYAQPCCPICKYPLSSEFEYCPKCGKRL